MTLNADTLKSLLYDSVVWLGHVSLAYMATILGFIVSMVLIVVVGDRVSIRWLIAEPVWGVEMVCGFLAGHWCYRKFPSRTAFLAWCVPGTILFTIVLQWQHKMSQYDPTWQTFFGMRCGGSECLYQLFLTAPFYTAVSYSVGAAFGQRTKKAGV